MRQSCKLIDFLYFSRIVFLEFPNFTRPDRKRILLKPAEITEPDGQESGSPSGLCLNNAIQSFKSEPLQKG